MIPKIACALSAIVTLVLPANATPAKKALRDVMCLARDELQDISGRLALDAAGVEQAQRWLVDRNGSPAVFKKTDDGGFIMAWNGFPGNGPARRYERKLTVKATPNAASGIIRLSDTCKAM